MSLSLAHWNNGTECGIVTHKTLLSFHPCSLSFHQFSFEVICTHTSLWQRREHVLRSSPNVPTLTAETCKRKGGGMKLTKRVWMRKRPGNLNYWNSSCKDSYCKRNHRVASFELSKTDTIGFRTPFIDFGLNSFG